MNDNEQHVMNLKDPIEAIDFLITFTGKLSRKDLVSFADITKATATRWISVFNEQYENWLTYENRTYLPTKNYQFGTLFKHHAEDGLRLIAFGSVVRKILEVVTCSNELPNIRGNADSKLIGVSEVCRAICEDRPITMQYSSTTSGKTERVLYPHSIFNAGCQWYVRAYSIHKDVGSYRSFRFSRILNADSKVGTHTKPGADIKGSDEDWNERDILSICPHPDHSERASLAADMGISVGSVKNYNICRALVPYFLIDNHIDYSPNHSQNPIVCQYWLANHSDVPMPEFMKL